MSVHIIPGQDDLTLAIGAGGDKTVTVPVTGGTHAKIMNEDQTQHVLYTFDPTPSFPADWDRIDPGEEVMVPTGGSTNLYLRKKTYVRGIHALNDVPIPVQVGLTNQAT